MNLYIVIHDASSVCVALKILFLKCLRRAIGFTFYPLIQSHSMELSLAFLSVVPVCSRRIGSIIASGDG